MERERKETAPISSKKKKNRGKGGRELNGKEEEMKSTFLSKEEKERKDHILAISKSEKRGETGEEKIHLSFSFEEKSSHSTEKKKSKHMQRVSYLEKGGRLSFLLNQPGVGPKKGKKKVVYILSMI